MLATSIILHAKDRFVLKKKKFWKPLHYITADLTLFVCLFVCVICPGSGEDKQPQDGRDGTDWFHAQSFRRCGETQVRSSRTLQLPARSVPSQVRFKGSLLKKGKRFLPVRVTYWNYRHFDRTERPYSLCGCQGRVGHMTEDSTWWGIS